MRRLLLLIFGLLLLLWGRAILADGGVASAVALRDGLLVILGGLVLFAANSRSLFPTSTSAGDTPLPGWTRVVAGISFGLALVGSGWMAMAVAGGISAGALFLPLLLWLGGLAAGVGVLFWPRRDRAVPAPGVWTVESARQFLQNRAKRSAKDERGLLLLSPRSRLLWLGLLVVVGLLLRVWNFSGLTSGCLPPECSGILAGMAFGRTGDLAALLATPSPAFTLLLSSALNVLGTSQNSTLLLGLLLAGVGIPLFYGALSRFVPAVYALLGTLLFLFSPFHIALSRHPSPALLLITGLFGLLAVRPISPSPNPARLAATGVLGGLLLMAAPPPLALLLFLWLLLTPPAGKTGWLAYYGPLAAAALPGLARGLGWDSFAETFAGGSIASLGMTAAEVLARMVQDGGFLPGVLALLGGASLVRYVRLRQGWLWTAGFVTLSLPLFATPFAMNTLFLAPTIVLLSVGAAVTIAQLLDSFLLVWSRVLPPRRVVASAAVLLGLLLAIGGGSRLYGLAEDMGSDGNQSGAAIGTFLHKRLADIGGNGIGEDGPLMIVPRAVLDSPSTQLAAQGLLANSPHILPLDPVAHLPYTGPPFIEQGMGDLLYIVPAQDRDLAERLTQLYPGSIAEPIADDGGPVLAVAYSVPRAAAAGVQGLPALYYAGEESGQMQDAAAAQREGPLAFDWGGSAPLVPPFTMEGQGALYVPQAGVYGFRLVTEGDVSAQMLLHTLPGPSVRLDSDAGGNDAGSNEVTVDLPQGFFPLEVTAHSRGTGDRLAVQWQRPGGAWESIPRPALYNPEAVQTNGILARYYGSGADDSAVEASGVNFANLAAAPLLGWRVEPWLDGSDLLPLSRGVVWQAKIAAPVDGTYGFEVQANGAHQLEIDGILLIDAASGLKSSTTSLLLSQGWHDLTLRYLPRGNGKLELLWQPPGAGTQKGIASAFLSPAPAQVDFVGIALPDLPAPDPSPAAMTALPPGESAFTQELIVPAADGLPGDLPDLPFSLLWQVGTCGTDVEQFLQPRGVAINRFNELVYVADQGNRRIVLRDLADGGLVDYYSSELFEEPFDIDVNLLGQVFVLDAVAQVIYQMEEPGGTPIVQPNETAFYRPRGMGMDLNGSFYVADTGGARIVKVSGIDGKVELQVGGPDSALGQGQPVDVMPLPTGAIYAVTAQDGTLWRLDTGESWTATAPANTFDAPHLAGLTTSNFFLTDPERRMVIYFDENGQALGQLRSELFAKPVGVAGLILDTNLLLAVSDSAACQLSLWSAPLDAMPVGGE